MDGIGEIRGQDAYTGRSWAISIDPETGLIAVARIEPGSSEPGGWRVLDPVDAERVACVLADAVSEAARSGGPIRLDLSTILEP